MKPSDYKFSIQNYPDTGDCIIFEHSDPGDCEVWEDLEEFIDEKILGFYRLDEATYEFDGDISQAPALLKSVGFVERESDES